MSVFILNLKQAFRNLNHNGWQATISVVGFVVGVVSLSFSMNWLWTEMNYDYFRPDYKDLYVLCSSDSAGEKSIWHSCLLGEQLDALADSSLDYCVYRNPIRQKVGLPVTEGSDEFYVDCLPVSSGFLKTMGVKVLSGSAEKTLAMPGNNQVMITRGTARRLFGSEDVVGRHLRCSERKGETERVVGAVIEDNTGNTYVKYDMLCAIEIQDYERSWEVGGYHVVVRNTDPRIWKSRLEKLRLQQPDKQLTFHLSPLRTLRRTGYTSSFLEAYFYELAFFIVSLILAVCGWVNIIAVYTSIYIGRSREYFLRRTLGASFLSNYGWILTGILPVIAIGVMLVFLVEEWAEYGGYILGNTWHIRISLTQVTVGFCVSVIVGMLYPAAKLQRMYRKSFHGQSGGGQAHGWLLVVQCFACAFLLFLSLGMQRQIYGMINTPLGFDRENILRLYTGWDNLPGQDERFDFNSFFYDLPDEFRCESSDITDAIAMRSDIFNRVTSRKINLTDESPDHRTRDYTYDSEVENGIDYVEIPFRAQEFFNLDIDGEPLTEEGECEGQLQVLMNKAAVARFHPERQPLYTGRLIYGNMLLVKSGFDSKVQHYEDKALQMKGLIGIHPLDFHQKECPFMLLGVPERHECVYVEHDAVYIKYAPGRRAEAEDAIRRVLARHDVPEMDILLTSFDEYIARSYEEECRYLDLLVILTAFCVFVTLFGVVSMLLYSLRLCRRSMAIRRVMGAGWCDILMPTLRRYACFVLIGCVTAYFPAVWLLRRWMEHFFFGEMPGRGLMAMIASGMLFMVEIIVCWQVHRSMTDKPVEVLQPES